MRILHTVRAVLLVSLMFLLVSEQAYSQRSKRKTSISIDRGGKSSYHWNNGRYSLKVEFEGELEWTDDDTGVKSMSRGSYLEIQEKTRSDKHEIVITPESNGEINYAYRYKGKKKPFDADAQEWLADVLQEFIRESGIGAEARTIRILERRGVDGLLQEVDLISSPTVKSRYLMHMFEHAELTGSQAAKAARTASGISSPGDKTKFLQATAKAFLIHQEAREPYFETARTISSPGDKTRLLIHLVQDDLLMDTDSYLMALEVARTISSPGDKARFMIAAAPLFVPEATDDYFDTVNTISSPGDHARVLIALLGQRNLDRTTMEQLFLSARKISSPGDKARVLTKAAEYMEDLGVSEEGVELYLEAARSISSPGDRARVLIHLFESVDLTDASILEWLETARTVSSPGDKARVLLRAADTINDNDELVEAYIDTAETISSPGDRRRVLEALLD